MVTLCQPPIFRRAEDAACSKPGVHVSESPGRFCSCDKAPFGWCGLRGARWVGVVCVCYVVKKTTAPNSKTSPNPPTKTGSHFFFGGEGGVLGWFWRPFFFWMVSFWKDLEGKKDVNWFCKILWWKEIQVIRKNWLMIDCVFLWMPAESRGDHQPSSLFWAVVMTGQPSPPNLPPLEIAGLMKGSLTIGFP